MLKSRFPEIIIELEIATEMAIEEGAEWVERDAKARVPVATGKLRDAIHIDNQQDEGIYVVGGDDEAWYGHFVEYGTVGGTRSSPRPFLVPALEENRENITNAVRAALGQL